MVRHLAAALLLVTLPVSQSHAFSFRRAATDNKVEQPTQHEDRGEKRKTLLGKVKRLVGQKHEARNDDTNAENANRLLLEVKAKSAKQLVTKKIKTAKATNVAHAEPITEVHVAKIEKETFGDRLADKVTSLAGSWKFINYFTLTTLTWIGYNLISPHPIDPAPFMGLNLFMSMMAMLQAPFILMSSNRQAKKDALRAQADYDVNIKAEGEVQALHEKVDAQAAKIDDLTKLLTRTLEHLPEHVAQAKSE